MRIIVLYVWYSALHIVAATQVLVHVVGKKMTKMATELGLEIVWFLDRQKEDPSCSKKKDIETSGRRVFSMSVYPNDNQD